MGCLSGGGGGGGGGGVAKLMHRFCAITRNCLCMKLLAKICISITWGGGGGGGGGGLQPP